MSRYSKLLMKIIAESGLTAKEVVEKCNELGNGIDTTRLSKLQNGKLSAPSEKVSRDISKVCNADERKLVIEGYLEKAPQEIVETFITLKINTMITALRMFQNNLTKEQIELMKNAMEKEPVSEYIIDVLDSRNDVIDITLDDLNIQSKEFTFKMEEPIALPINDNAMFPLIPEKSKINLKKEMKYKNGDILAVEIKELKEIIIRYALFSENNIILTALNTKYEPLTYKLDDVKIVGKVAKVITEI